MSIFNEVKETSVGRNYFDLTHDVKLSTLFGKLTPCCVIDTIPGDKFTIKGSAMVRLAPTIAPVMHRADVYMHYFFVPNRIVWPGFEDFITGGRTGEDNTVHPYLGMSTSFSGNGTTPDYMGLPTEEDVGTKTYQINPIPLAAFHKIWNDYYRDQNMSPEIDTELEDGDNITKLGTLIATRRRAWSHDYFTSGLPWTQRGPEALLPLGTTAPLKVIDGFPVQQGYADQTDGTKADTFGVGYTTQYQSDTGGDDAGTTIQGFTNRHYVMVEESHEVDLSQSTASSIIELRRALALQTWLEKNALGGSRYNEVVKVHFDVTTSDQRINRPEYIGGFKSPIKMSEVLQTGESNTTPQGTMAGHGISVGGSKSLKYYCEEHGYIIGILSVLPKPAYQQGIPKHFLRSDKFDYAWPSFAHIGEQPIENQELYLSGVPATDTDTWGYTPRYAEYKFQNNRVAGDFNTSLDFWHMTRKFSSLPPLNAAFIECQDNEVERIFAVQGSEDNLWCQVLNDVGVSRKLPKFGEPKIR